MHHILRLASFFLLLLLPMGTLAGAAQVQLGSTNVEFSLPAGFVNLEGQAYATLADHLRRMQPEALRVEAIWVPPASHQNPDQAAQIAAGLSSYMVLSTPTTLNDQVLNTRQFADLKNAARQSVEKARQTLKEDVNKRLAQDNMGQLQLEDVESLGCYNDKDTTLTCLMLMDQQQAGQNKRQAVASTFALVQGKVFFINHYQDMNEKDIKISLDQFRQTALSTIESMNLPMGTPATFWSGMGSTLLIGVMGGVLGVLVVWWRRKNK